MEEDCAAIVALACATIGREELVLDLLGAKTSRLMSSVLTVRMMSSWRVVHGAEGLLLLHGAPAAEILWHAHVERVGGQALEGALEQLVAALDRIGRYVSRRRRCRP